MLKGDLIEQKVTNKTSCYAFSPTVLTLRLEFFLGHYSIVCQSPIYEQFSQQGLNSTEKSFEYHSTYQDKMLKL